MFSLATEIITCDYLKEEPMRAFILNCVSVKSKCRAFTLEKIRGTKGDTPLSDASSFILKLENKEK